MSKMRPHNKRMGKTAEKREFEAARRLFFRRGSALRHVRRAGSRPPRPRKNNRDTWEYFLTNVTISIY